MALAPYLPRRCGQAQPTGAAFALGLSLFFVGYALFETPSNLIMHRVGARRWLSRIMVTWGLVSAAMMFVRSTEVFYVLRFLLGALGGFVAPNLRV